MSIYKTVLLYFGLCMALVLPTYYVTRQATILEVVDNITYFCYNSSGGAILEGRNGVYILCQGVHLEEPPRQLPLDNQEEV